MKPKIKSIAVYLPKIIIFGLALCNFISIWLEAEFSKNIGALAPPWYHPWSYCNEPSLLLCASALLLLNQWQSNLFSAFVSGFVIAKAVYLISVFGGFVNWLRWLSEQWTFSEGYKNNILKEWEAQLMLAVILFVVGLAYLICDLFKKFSGEKNLG